MTLNPEGEKQLTVELHSAQFKVNLAPPRQAAYLSIGYIELPSTEGRGQLPDCRCYAEVVQQYIRWLEQGYSVVRWIVVYQGAISPNTSVELNWSQFGTDTDPVLSAAVVWLT